MFRTDAVNPNSVNLAHDVRVSKVLKNAYLLLAVSLIPSIIGAALGARFPIAYQLGFWMLPIFIGVMFGMNFLIMKNRNSVSGIGWLLLYTLILGFFIGPLIGSIMGSFTNGFQIVASAVGSTAAIFFALAGYAAATKKNLSTPGMGNLIAVGMTIALIMMVLNFFIQVPAVTLALSTMFAVISSCLIVYTINGVVRGGETNYIMVTLSLYISLYNIFSWALHMFSMFFGSHD